MGERQTRPEKRHTSRCLRRGNSCFHEELAHRPMSRMSSRSSTFDFSSSENRLPLLYSPWSLCNRTATVIKPNRQACFQGLLPVGLVVDARRAGQEQRHAVHLLIDGLAGLAAPTHCLSSPMELRVQRTLLMLSNCERTLISMNSSPRFFLHLNGEFLGTWPMKLSPPTSRATSPG